MYTRTQDFTKLYSVLIHYCVQNYMRYKIIHTTFFKCIYFLRYNNILFFKHNKNYAIQVDTHKRYNCNTVYLWPQKTTNYVLMIQHSELDELIITRAS